jgi:dATP pyrophosphohydrolase
MPRDKRKPENVHVFLYRKNKDSDFEYAIFQRKDNLEWWQGVSGGVEEGELPEQAALRESYEEAGTPLNMPIYRLDTISYIPSNIFTDHVWDKDILMVPMFHFAMPFDGEITLSHEHTVAKWLGYEEAEQCIYFHDTKNALWELNQRLLRGNIVRTY